MYSGGLCAATMSVTDLRLPLFVLVDDDRRSLSVIRHKYIQAKWRRTIWLFVGRSCFVMFFHHYLNLVILPETWTHYFWVVERTRCVLAFSRGLTNLTKVIYHQLAIHMGASLLV